NQPGAVHRLWIETMARAHGVAGAEAASMMTDRRFMDRGANRVPETLPDAVEALEMPHATAAGAGPDGLATAGRDHLAQAVGELGKRGVPCGALEPTGALGADAAHGIEQAIGRMHMVEIAVHLHAEAPTGERVIAGSVQTDRPPILDCDLPAAGV